MLHVLREELIKEFGSMLKTELQKLQVEKQPQTEKAVYTRQEVKELLNVSYGTLCNWNKNEVLKQVKIGSRVYYSKADVLATFDNIQKK
ncbi:MAG: hypothetical protein K0R77_2149 [Chryseobacterium sp.]|jgi:hypothetical protein|nr:hypothetical protein [Chryseobacterium sp.]